LKDERKECCRKKLSMSDDELFLLERMKSREKMLVVDKRECVDWLATGRLSKRGSHASGLVDPSRHIPVPDLSSKIDNAGHFTSSMCLFTSARAMKTIW